MIPEKNFDPQRQLDRGTAALMLAGMLAFDLQEESLTAPFPDVSVRKTYAQAIALLKKQGIVKGYGDGLFRPGNTLTRAEAYKVLYLASGKPMNESAASCTDLSTGAWYQPFMKAAFHDELILGGAESRCQPDRVITRAEYAELLIRFFGV